MSCTSTWRGAGRKRSTYTSGRPNDDADSRWAAASDSAAVVGSGEHAHAATAPPCTALTVSGQPNCSPSSITAAASSTATAAPGTRGTPASGRPAGRELVAHQRDHLGRRADPRQAGTGHGRGEVGSFGEEAVAGVHGIAPRTEGRRDDAIDVEVRLARRRAGEADRVVGELDGERTGVRVAVHDDRLHRQSMARPDHANGDLAAVGDEDPLHGVDRSCTARQTSARSERCVRSDRPVAERRHDLLAEQSHRVQPIGPERRSERDVAGALGTSAPHLVTTSAGVPNTPSVNISGGSR